VAKLQHTNDVAVATRKGFKMRCDEYTIHNDVGDNEKSIVYDDADNDQTSDPFFHSVDNCDHITSTTYDNHTLGKLNASLAKLHHGPVDYTSRTSDCINSLEKFDTNGMASYYVRGDYFAHSFNTRSINTRSINTRNSNNIIDAVTPPRVYGDHVTDGDDSEV
jgi:hypothetical protein